MIDERTLDILATVFEAPTENRRSAFVFAVFVIGGISFLYLTLFRRDIGAAFWVWLVVIGVVYWYVRSVYRSSAGKSIVLWLRRFHSVELYRFPMLETLKSAGDFKFHLVTIQDSKFQYSFVSGANRSGCSLVFFFFFLAFPLVMLSLALSIKILGFEPSGATGFAGMLELVPVLLLTAPILAAFFYPTYALIVYIIVRFRGVERLLAYNFGRRIRSWSKRVRKGRSGPFASLKIFKCKDKFWQDAVVELLGIADIVAIDVSDLNENVAWEVRKTAELVGAERILFMYAVPVDAYSSDTVPETIIADLYQIIGEDIYKALFWDYPEPLPVEKGKPKLGHRNRRETAETLTAGLDQMLGIDEAC